MIVVEHDQDTIRAADWVVDVGPGRGRAGRPDGGQRDAWQTWRRRRSRSPGRTCPGAGDRGAAAAAPARQRRRELVVEGAREHNLRDIDVDVPAGQFVAVTGVSGSGKSSLVSDMLYPALAHRLHGAAAGAGAARRVTGIEHLDKVIEVDQSPDRAHAAVQPGHLHRGFDHIRKLFAQTAEAKVRGYQPGRFSLQRQGRTLRGLPGRGHDQDRDALPAGRLRALRGVQGHALQPRDAGGAATRARRSPRCWT